MGFTHRYATGRPTYLSKGKDTKLPSCYRFDVRQTSWIEAKRYCKCLGANLVSIETLEEHQFLNSVIKENAIYRQAGLPYNLLLLFLSNYFFDICIY